MESYLDGSGAVVVISFLLAVILYIENVPRAINYRKLKEDFDCQKLNEEKKNILYALCNKNGNEETQKRDLKIIAFADDHRKKKKEVAFYLQAFVGIDISLMVIILGLVARISWGACLVHQDKNNCIYCFDFILSLVFFVFALVFLGAHIYFGWRRWNEIGKSLKKFSKMKEQEILESTEKKLKELEKIP